MIHTLVDQITAEIEQEQAARGGRKKGEVDLSTGIRFKAEAEIFIAQADTTIGLGEREFQAASEAEKKRKDAGGSYSAPSYDRDTGANKSIVDPYSGATVRATSNGGMTYFEFIGYTGVHTDPTRKAQDRKHIKTGMKTIRFQLTSDNEGQTGVEQALEIKTCVDQLKTFRDSAQRFVQQMQSLGVA
jgi:hypothetical protein